VHDRVALPEPVTLLGLMEPQARPEGMISARVTLLAKPFNAVIVMVEVVETPTLTWAGNVAAIAKSWKLKVIVVECVREPLVPVTVRV